MNGEIPSVPITTLAGVSSLVDLLPEMPLPSPLPQTLGNKSLLFHPRVAEEAQRLLATNDDNLIPQLVHSLSQTSSKHIELKDHYSDIPLDIPNAPRLLSGILRRKADVFKGKHEQNMADWNHSSNQMTLYGVGSSTSITSDLQSQHLPSSSSTSHLSLSQVDLQSSHTSDILNSNNSRNSMMSDMSYMSEGGIHGGNRNERPSPVLPTQGSDNCSVPLQPPVYHGTAGANHSQSHSKHPFPGGSQSSNYPQTSGHNSSSSIQIPPGLHKGQQPPGLSHPQQSQSPLHPQYSQSQPLPSLQNQQSSIPPSPHSTAVSSHHAHESRHHHSSSHHHIQPMGPAGSPFANNVSPMGGSSNSPSKQPLTSQHLPHGDIMHASSGAGASNVHHNVQFEPTNHASQYHSPHHQEDVHLVGGSRNNNMTTGQHERVHSNSSGSPGVTPWSNDCTKVEQANSSSSLAGPTVNIMQQKQLVIKLERSDNMLAMSKQAASSTIPNNKFTSARSRQTSVNKGYKESSSEDEDTESPFKGKNKIKRKRELKGDSDYYSETGDSHAKKMTGPIAESSDGAQADTPKKKIRRVERMLIPVIEKLGSNALSNNTYQRFLKAMDVILESIDNDRNDIELDDDEAVSEDVLIPKHQLTEICAEAAKLKTLGAMEAIPTEKLIRLLNILDKNIREGCKVTPLADGDDDYENRLWVDMAMESIQRGVLASLTALHILTSQNMPKRVYLEDLIDRMVIFTKFQLQNTIFPSFDPVYRVDPKGKSFSSSKKKRAHAKEVKEKSMISFYTKIHEVVGLLAELLGVQVLTDTTVLHLSTLGVAPFFVENVSELQLTSLRLVTAIFTQYDKHRRLLLDDILASIARLPSSKRSLRTFKLSSGSDEYIQMLTALVLQLIQCVTHLPEKWGIGPKSIKTENAETPSQKINEKDSLIASKFDVALRTAGNFLAVFLSKCGTKSEDIDYRPLFENFVQDLLSTVNKPEWPASELLLSLLGNLLVKNLGNKNLEVSLRVASLEYLGVAASRLRKDAVSTRTRMSTIDRIISDIKSEEEQYSSDSKPPIDLSSDEEKTEFLQRVLLDYLAVHGQSDPALMQARHFYVASWWKSAQADIAKSLKSSTQTNQKVKKKKKKKSEGSSSEEESDSEDSEADDGNKDTSINVLQLTEQRKTFLLTKIRPFSDSVASRKTEVVQTFVDYQSAELIARYLASKRPFSASFDFFLTRILSVSTEQTVAIRTKALKCLTMVVEADPTVLARHDMQLWVQNSFLDQSTAVREAAVDLIGKYVLSCPDLIEKYYEILALRILDTGVSVRKRVIKIMRDICVEFPTFSKIPEICVKMIRRVNDEDGIRKLVMEVFQNMWFVPVREEPLDRESLLRKVSIMTDVVASCEKVGLDFFEQLLLSLFKPKEEKDQDVREKAKNQEPPKSVLVASLQIVNCLVEHVLRIEENTDTGANQNSQRFVACVATLVLFAKIRPQLLVNHAITLEGYLSLRCQNQAELLAVANICNILELVVPLLVNPAESFLAQMEEDCVKLLFKNEKQVIDSCLACLGAVINKITHNYKLVRDVFRRFQTVLLNQIRLYKENASDARLNDNRPLFRRSVYTVGLILRYFDFSKPGIYGDYPSDIVQQVFNQLLFLLSTPCSDLHYFSLQAIGNLCIRHYEFMLGDDLKRIYDRILTSSEEIKLKVQALSNIQLYLTEEELRMIRLDQEWTKNAKMENLKEMGDVTSGMASTIVQIYLRQILESFLHKDLTVRLAAVRVVQLVLQQGLVHPIQIVPYLICMSTDDEPGVSTTADKQLQEMEKKHPQFLQSQVLKGVRLSLQLQKILHFAKLKSQNSEYNCFEVFENKVIVRGFRIRPKEGPSALNGFLYSLLRSTKPQRRGIAQLLLKQFDEQSRNSLSDLLYYADNLAYFPYQVVDEPLFLIHQIDINISVTGSNLLQAFKEALIPLNPQPENPEAMFNSVNENGQPIISEANKVTDIMEDEDEEDIDALVARVPEDTKTLEDCIVGSQGCLLLLMLKQHLKDTYGLTEAKISGYSPSDATKVYERPVNRRNCPQFEPKCTISCLQQPPSGATPEGKQQLVEQYLHFKQLMLRIDPEEGEEDGEPKPNKVKLDTSMFTYQAKPNIRPPPTFPPSTSVQQLPTSSYVVNHPGGVPSSSNAVNDTHMTSSHSHVTHNTLPPKEQQLVPKLTIVPLKFPNNQGKKTHKIKEHHHHHKHKKSKHKKKKRCYTVSDDDDSDNPDSDPDFRI